MSNKYLTRPAITIDFKKDRIRIYKRTLHSIGNPEFIHLLVNPEERTLAILRSDRSDLRSYRLPKARFEDKQSFEITSKSLMRGLLGMCDDWQDNHSYRIYGDIVANEEVVQFNFADATMTFGTRG